MVLLQLKVPTTCSCVVLPERVLDRDVAVHGDGQQAKDRALGQHQDEASDEKASVEVGAKASTGVS